MAAAVPWQWDARGTFQLAVSIQKDKHETVHPAIGIRGYQTLCVGGECTKGRERLHASVGGGKHSATMHHVVKGCGNLGIQGLRFRAATVKMLMADQASAITSRAIHMTRSNGGVELQLALLASPALTVQRNANSGTAKQIWEVGCTGHGSAWHESWQLCDSTLNQIDQKWCTTGWSISLH